MSPFSKCIPVVDLFSGPGGLAEGFASLQQGNAFRVMLSAEMDTAAHKTLRLRSYFRLLHHSGVSRNAYYDFCNGHAKEPWAGNLTRDLWEESDKEALNITLGTEDGDRALFSEIDHRIQPGDDCVLIGGPPCQAYSFAGRSRNRGKPEYRPEDDHRHFLYREYLRVISRTRPAVFVMENVKGILSSRVAGRRIFHDILSDLASPSGEFSTHSTNDLHYRIYSLSTGACFSSGMDVSDISPNDFVIRAEDHGIPQARHRVILLGVRSDINKVPAALPRYGRPVTVWEAIGDLPEIRSQISGKGDSVSLWVEAVSEYLREMGISAGMQDDSTFEAYLREMSARIVGLPLGANRLRGATHRGIATTSQFLQQVIDPNLEVILNHESRSHMREDLKRYAFAACFAEREGRSPKGHQEFNLPGLAPRHANWETGNFADRFRVQLRDAPSTTITSHISKDGHYYIHPEPRQCRSLTVREAARLQTFPDNYYFQGNRTQQYHQVGNAVPPLLARLIALAVLNLFTGSGRCESHLSSIRDERYRVS
jgi:DNA (cytosine-5)-methyltransferase 1